MKKTLLLIIGFASLFALTSCIKDYVTEEHINEYYNGAKLQTVEYTIEPNDWQNGDFNGRKYLYCTVDNENLTNYMLENGAVFGYMWTQYSEENYCWSPLPYVYPLVVEDKVIPENFRIEIEEGVVTFIIEDLDAGDVLDMDRSVDFKIVTMAE